MKPNDLKIDAMREAEDIASVMECTGLMPALPQDDAQADSLAALYAIHGVKEQTGATGGSAQNRKE